MLVNSFLRSENIIESPVSRRYVTLSQQLQGQKADHLQEIEKTEEEGRKAACGFGEIGENCDFTSSWKGLAEFEVPFTNPERSRASSRARG